MAQDGEKRSACKIENSEAKWRQGAQYWRGVESQIILRGQND
jgi:hypothetical protein